MQLLRITVRPEFIEGFLLNGSFVLRQAQSEWHSIDDIMTQLADPESSPPYPL